MPEERRQPTDAAGAAAAAAAAPVAQPRPQAYCAGSIILNSDAELGPLDVQIFDREREEFSSALDEVQTVERLQAASLALIDQTMMLLLSRTGKKVESTLPQVLKFVSDMMRPMFENIDVVHFTQRARFLKVAEEYAIRLLRPRHNKDHAEAIAR